MATFSKLTKQRLMDWFRGCDGGGSPMPSDQDIMDKFGIFSEEKVRDLLAELADEGGISVKWGPGRARTITLGAKEHRRVEHDRAPLPPAVRKADTSVDDGTAKIMAIIARRTAVVDQVNAEAAATSKRRLQAASSGTTIRSFDKPAALPDSLTLPPPIETTVVDMTRLPTAPGRSPAPPKVAPAPTGARQINARVSAAEYDEIARRAAERGIACSAVARELVLHALSLHGKPEAPATKPRVSAAVMAAMRDDGRDFGAFITYLIDLGLDRHNGLVAEAAE